MSDLAETRSDGSGRRCRTLAETRSDVIRADVGPLADTQVRPTQRRCRTLAEDLVPTNHIAVDVGPLVETQPTDPRRCRTPSRDLQSDQLASMSDLAETSSDQLKRRCRTQAEILGLDEPAPDVGRSRDLVRSIYTPRSHGSGKVRIRAASAPSQTSAPHGSRCGTGGGGAATRCPRCPGRRRARTPRPGGARRASATEQRAPRGARPASGRRRRRGRPRPWRCLEPRRGTSSQKDGGGKKPPLVAGVAETRRGGMSWSPAGRRGGRGGSFKARRARGRPGPAARGR